mmetsp:Transcript_27856/g.47350  ORF Transcript_27856/g.47350 Transcript_27856/m.47350 type:complete len:402 (-) Transcript_27856:760-1965(-)
MHPCKPPRVTSLLAHIISALFLTILVVSIAGNVPAASAFASLRQPSTPRSPIMELSAASRTTLGSSALQNLVQDANISFQKHSVDLNGIVWLEHLNLVVGDMDLAKKFYVEFLGFSRDGNQKHFNLGQQQFHLAANEDPPQRITGSIGLVVPSLQRIRDRVGDVEDDLKGTLFSISEDDKDPNMMTITCPWGNIIHLYDMSIDENYSAGETIKSPQKMVTMHKEGGAYGAHRMSVRGNPGIRYVEIACRVGSIESIADFYENTLGCHVTRTSSGFDSDSTTNGKVEVAVVCVGPGVHMIFVENQQLANDIIKQMEGVHACIYIPNFRGMYNSLKERNLIWTNPRFTHLDSCDTWEEACASRTFRFKDIINLKTGEKILEFEHETRPMLHGQYMKVPPYVPN